MHNDCTEAMIKRINSLTGRLKTSYSDIEKFGYKTEAELEEFSRKTLDYSISPEENTIAEIFKGRIKTDENGVQYLTGYHYENSDALAKITGVKEYSTAKNGVYRAKIEASGIAKPANGGYSSFYPDDWTRKDIVDAIDDVYWNGSNVSSIKRVGTYKGVKIEIITDKEGFIITAYPSWPQ